MEGAVFLIKGQQLTFEGKGVILLTKDTPHQHIAATIWDPEEDTEPEAGGDA